MIMEQLGNAIRQIEPFFLFRRLLMIFCSVYALIRLTQSASRWYGYFWSPDRSRRVLRHYLHVHLLRVRFLRFWRDLLQIAVLTAVFLVIVWLHRFLELPRP